MLVSENSLYRAGAAIFLIRPETDGDGFQRECIDERMIRGVDVREVTGM